MNKDERIRIMQRILEALGSGEPKVYNTEDWWIINHLAYLLSLTITPDGEIVSL